MAYPMLFLGHGDVTVGFDDFNDAGEFKDLRDVADTFRLNPVTLTIGGMKLNMHRGTYASTNLQVRLRKIHEVEPDKGSTAHNPIPLGGMAAGPADPTAAAAAPGSYIAALGATAGLTPALLQMTVLGLAQIAAAARDKPPSVRPQDEFHSAARGVWGPGSLKSWLRTLAPLGDVLTLKGGWEGAADAETGSDHVPLLAADRNKDHMT